MNVRRLLTRRGFCVKFLGKLLYCVSISLQIGVEIEKHDTMLWLGEIKQSMCGPS